MSRTVARRLDRIAPFHVMDILARARQLEAQGRDVVHLEIGEPDFIAPDVVQNAGIEALSQGQTHYTPALGLPELRQAISNYYRQHYRLNVAPERIVVSTGASAALMLALSAIVDAGDGVLLSDPGYPCNRHFVETLSAQPQMIPVGAETAFQPDLGLIQQYWQANTRAVMLASPSNPCGTLISREILKLIADYTDQQSAWLVVDEIYKDLSYSGLGETALQISDQLLVINSFSKFFAMTGWRLGWLVVPEALVDGVDRLAQNLYLAPPTAAQYAALAALGEESWGVCEERRQVFQQRRDYLYQALTDLGFRIPVKPDGAFYLYADCSAFTEDSFGFTQRLLDEAAVAITPGKDFGDHRASSYVRFAYTTDMASLQKGVERLKSFLA